MSQTLTDAGVLVIGAGIMGSGIAQVAAQAGHAVMLYDTQAGVAARAKADLATTFEKLVAKGKFSEAAARQTLALIEPIHSLEAAIEADLVIEAIIEDLEIKRCLFQHLEGIVANDCVLATNTSSISVSAIANGLQHPHRLVGMHFFNPVALMKLVEVISGLQTSSAVADAIFALAQNWGKHPVHARSTPGFIVNRIARPYYAETLSLLQQQAATPQVLDACLRAAGFRMGPCELMDLIGHDTNLAVSRSVYAANFYDRRYAPSVLQQELVDGGLLGRKSGRGFFDYSEQQANTDSVFEVPQGLPANDHLHVHGSAAAAERIAHMLQQHNCNFGRVSDSDWCGLQAGSAQLRLTDGRCAGELGAEVAVFDLALQPGDAIALAWSHASGAGAQWISDAPQWLALCGFHPHKIEDVPGLVVARTIAMLINEAADAVQQGVCSEADADAAMRLGVNYPAGPFEWLSRWDASVVIGLLDALDHYYRGERYRVSPRLRQYAWRSA